MKLSTIRRPLNAAAQEAVQARFALRLCAQLNEDPRPLDPGVIERLRFARQQASQVAASSRRPARRRSVQGLQLPTTLGGWVGLRSDGSLAWKLVSLVPAAMLVLGFVGINWLDQEEQANATADVDVALLSDDVPPNAYADPGFAEFLRTSSTTPPITQP